MITAHLQEDAGVSWQGLDFDFTGAVFDGGHHCAAADRVGPPPVCCRLLVTGEPISHATANGAAAAGLAAARGHVQP